MEVYDELERALKEIERLNNQLEEKTYLYNKLSTESKYTIERLNNIINELEQWLEEQKHFIINTPSYTEEIKVEHKIMFNDYENVLIKIEELKGSDKE